MKIIVYANIYICKVICRIICKTFNVNIYKKLYFKLPYSSTLKHYFKFNVNHILYLDFENWNFRRLLHLINFVKLLVIHEVPSSFNVHAKNKRFLNSNLNIFSPLTIRHLDCYYIKKDL